MHDPLDGASVERVKALYRSGLLDTPAEVGFDRVTSLVMRIFDVPVSIVSLVDLNRQFFKSAQGLAEPWASLRETPLSHSFCQHVVQREAILAVENAPDDPLTCGNLAIRDLGVQSYLGAPLITPEGYVLGSLCAIDTKPRCWSDEDARTLTELAGVVMSEIALRNEAALRREAERQQRILVQELQHRVKNSLATASALVNLSFEYAESLESCRDSIQDRLAALANAHACLIERKWGDVSLKALFDSEIRLLCESGVQAEGPEVSIPSSMVIYISMGLHELLTNALKHGALSVGGGQVSAAWSVSNTAGVNRVNLQWIESGGPSVADQRRSGFGTLLFEHILSAELNGQITRNFAAGGLRAAIEFDVPACRPGRTPASL